jgi:hypothetical protein
MKAAKNYLLMQERVKARQDAGARQWDKKISKNLLDGVEDSLQRRQLHVDRPAAKRLMEQTAHSAK